MTRFQPLLTVAMALLLAGQFVSSLSAAPNEEQVLQLRALKVDIRKTSNFLRQGKISESVELVRDIQTRMEKLGAAGDAEVTKELQDLVQLLAVSHGFLELEGYTLKPLGAVAINTAPEAMMFDVPPPPPGSGPPPLPDVFPSTDLSFSKHIAPILIARCGNCHVNGAKGGFSAATFEALMKGPAAGRVIFPGDDTGSSRLIETIETGDMPRGGQKVKPVELAALKVWIKEGAKFDGADPKMPINQAGAAPNPAAMVKLEVAEATGSEKVSFGLDVAGVLANRCVGCHGGNNPRGNFDMTSFTQFIKGGDSGVPFMPGKPQESMIVRMIKATGNERMPRNGPPLTKEQIAKIETWILEGAKFDGSSPADPMQRTNQIAMAKVATHDQLAAMRQESSQQMWDLGMPNIESAKVDAPNFLAYGTMGEASLKGYVTQADEAAQKVRSILKIPTTTPIVKGKLTLYFFKQRYDYGEFGNMIEKRQLPDQWKGHYRYNVTDAYGSVLLPANDEYEVDALLGQVIASAHIASLGNGSVPDWFADGAGRVVASRISKKDPRVVEWESQIESALGSVTKPEDIVKSKLGPVNQAVANYAFMKVLMGRGSSFDALMGAMRKGTNFDVAFKAAYNMTPTELVNAWAKGG